MERVCINVLICMEYATSTALNLCCYFCTSKHEKMPCALRVLLLSCHLYEPVYKPGLCSCFVFLPALMHLNVLVEKNLYNNL